MTNREFFISTWSTEMDTTLTAINHLPTDQRKWSYTCHQKTRTASALVGHMLPHAEVIANSILTGVASEHSNPHKFESAEDAADYFGKWATKVSERLITASDSEWEGRIIDFQVDGHTFYKLPLGKMCWMLLFDIIHHRGQLSTYYRHMGVPNPNIYGPTAEDIEKLSTASN